MFLFIGRKFVRVHIRCNSQYISSLRPSAIYFFLFAKQQDDNYVIIMSHSAVHTRRLIGIIINYGTNESLTNSYIIGIIKNNSFLVVQQKN